MAALFDTIRQLAEDIDLDATEVTLGNGEPALAFTLEGENGSGAVIASVFGDTTVHAFASCPAKAPAKRRREVAEFLTRINWVLATATFEMDLTDGEIRVRTSGQFTPPGDPDGHGFPTLNAVALLELVAGAATTLDAWLPALMRLIYSDLTAEAVAGECFADADSDANDEDETDDDEDELEEEELDEEEDAPEPTREVSGAGAAPAAASDAYTDCDWCRKPIAYGNATLTVSRAIEQMDRTAEHPGGEVTVVDAAAVLTLCANCGNRLDVEALEKVLRSLTLGRAPQETA